MSADSPLKTSRDGAVGRRAQERGLFRMETWTGELKPAGFGPEVHQHRLPGDTLFCFKINQVKEQSVKHLTELHAFEQSQTQGLFTSFSSARKAAANSLVSGL